MTVAACCVHAQEFDWAKSVGGSNNDEGKSIAVDATGNVYTTGYFSGTVDFDPGSGTTNLTAIGDQDIFIQKLDSDGNLVWAKSVGGNMDDIGNSIVVDPAGNVYITGYFGGNVDFDPGPGTESLSSNGADDIFVQKLDSDGDFVWAKSLGGISADRGLSIAIDGLGNVITCGLFTATVDFDPDTGGSTVTSNGFADVFVQKWDSDGAFIWAKTVGDGSADIANSVAVDGSDNIIVTGYYSGTVDFDPNTGTENWSSSGSSIDAFVQKLDSDGNLVWANGIGSSGSDIAQAIAVDGSDNILVTGYFSGSVDFDPGSGTTSLTAVGGVDFFVLKLNSSGNFQWAINPGGSLDEFPYSIAVDENDNVYTVGSYNGTVDFDSGSGTTNLTPVGDYDLFILKVTSAGVFDWANSFGGPLGEGIFDITIGNAGEIYTTGYFQGTADLDPGTGTDDHTSAGFRDVFVQKLQPNDVGIESSFANNFRIYPNPANRTISLSTTNYNSLMIFNMLGEVVIQSSKSELTLNVSDLEKGTYLLQIQTEQGFMQEVFIKQ